MRKADEGQETMGRRLKDIKPDELVDVRSEVVRRIGRRAWSYEDEEDVVQVAFLKALQAGRIKDLRALMFDITRKYQFELLRRMYRAKRLCRCVSLDENIPSTDWLAGKASEEDAELWREVLDLPFDERIVTRLWMRDMPLQRIAVVWEITRRRAAELLDSALRRLRRNLEGAG